MKTPAIFPNCVGDRDRCEFRDLLPAIGCIARQQERVVLRRSGEIHRPQFRPLNCVIQLMTLGWLLAACEGLRW
jgi:hypothetical protein